MVLQVVYSVRKALLDSGDIETENGSVRVTEVIEVIDHVTMNNHLLQKQALTPDFYAYGLLSDGRYFEAIGDTKLKVSFLYLFMYFTSDYFKQSHCYSISRHPVIFSNTLRLSTNM